jgi:hypothetical protein
MVSYPKLPAGWSCEIWGSNNRDGAPESWVQRSGWYEGTVLRASIHHETADHEFLCLDPERPNLPSSFTAMGPDGQSAMDACVVVARTAGLFS